MLLDYGTLRDHRVRPLAYLNDSKELDIARREEPSVAVVACAERVSIRVVTHAEIDRSGLHASNLASLRAVLHALAPSAEICLVDGFRLGKKAPEHLAVVGGDGRSAAIAAASIVAKVVRDRVMRRLDALFPQYGFSSHVGYITPGHSARVREHGPSAIHRRRLPRSATRNRTRRSTRAVGRRAEWRAVVHYCLRGYRILGHNVWAGRYEVDLIVRRGRRLVFCEVKSKGGDRHGDPLEMVGPEKVARLRQAAEAWLRAHHSNRSSRRSRSSPYAEFERRDRADPVATLRGRCAPP